MSEVRLPWSQAAEQSLIGAAMLDPWVVSAVKTAEFFDGRHRAIWAAMQSLATRGQPIDVVTVHEALQGTEAGEDLPYLNALANSVMSARAAPRYAQIVAEHAAQRALLAALDEASATAGADGTVAEKLAKIDGLLAALHRSGTREPRRLSDLMAGRVDRVQEVAEGRVQVGMRTHFPRLDAMLTGGLKPGAVVVLAARPSVGKSSLAQWIGLRLAKDGHPTLMLSQEMPDTEVADRAIAALGRVSYEALQTGKMGDLDWGRLCDGVEAASALPFYVDDQPALRLSDIRAKARQVKGLRLLIVDYVQLCASDESANNRNAEVEAISRGLKVLAKEQGLCVLLLSQLNREVEKRASKEPILSDLRDSGAIEQDADVVAFLWPVREEEHGPRLIGMKLEKNRQGRKGRFGLAFEGAVQWWGESEEDITATTFKRRTGGDL
jgi:replicative DNA helicase